jgi:hypothetical protein
MEVTMASKAEFLPGVDLAATARVPSRAPETRLDVATLKALAAPCGIGPITSLLMATYGLDMSAGFF